MTMQTFKGLELEGQDALGSWHPVAVGRCECGCPYLYAIDDRTVRWLGGDWESDAQDDFRCIDRACACHHRGGERILRPMSFRQSKGPNPISEAGDEVETRQLVLTASS